MSKYIGTVTPDGIDWPEVTISGQVYTKPPTQTRTIAEGQFVVLDPFPAKDQYGNALFDVEAAIAALKPKAAPAPAKSKD